jgi:single-strand DNA-binding protein
MAASLNRATILGNLTRDPELRQTTSGQQVCSFAVATNRTWKNQQGEKQETAEYHNIVAWGKLAEICSQYLGKGRKVYIDGRLQTRDWEGQDGVRKYRTEIVAENMIMLDRPGQGSGGGGSSTFSDDFQGAKMPDAPADGDDEIRLEDIPF